MRRKTLGVSAFLLLILWTLIGVGGCSHYRENYRVRTMPIEDVSPECIPDGIYPGSFSYGGFAYAVEVGVAQHRIEWVEITRNRDTRYARKAERVVQNVIAHQSPDVDAVSGATTTSKALLKAVENAMINAGACGDVPDSVVKPLR